LPIAEKNNAMKRIILFAIMLATVSTSFAQKKKAPAKNSKTSYKKYVASVDQRTKKATDTLNFYSKQEDSLRLSADSLDLVVLDSTRQVWIDSMYSVVDSIGVQTATDIYSNQTAREKKETAVINSFREYKLSNTQLSRVRVVTSMYYDEVGIISRKENLMEVERNQRIAALNQDRNLKLKTIIGSKTLKKWMKKNNEEPTPTNKEK